MNRNDENCIFCKIVKGDIPCAKVWENENFLAFLDIKPGTKGMTLVIPKTHYDSYIFDIPSEIVNEIMVASKTVATMLEKAFDVRRVALVAEGMGVNHLHTKLYPLHGVNNKFQKMESKESMYFEKYVGYISTQLGPQADFGELQSIAHDIMSKSQK